MTYKNSFIKYVEGIPNYHCAKCDSYLNNFSPCCIRDQRRICRPCRAITHKNAFNDDSYRIFYNAKQYAKRKQLEFKLSKEKIKHMLSTSPIKEHFLSIQIRPIEIEKPFDINNAVFIVQSENLINKM